MDNDNDGLIEIWHLEALNNIRYDLDGSHYDDDGTREGTNINESDGSSEGCPADGCNGYELMRNLDFANASSYASGAINLDWRPTTGTGDTRRVATPDEATNPGWLPIAHDTNTSLLGIDHQGALFAAMLDGNGNTIANLYVKPTDSQHGVGFISAINGSSTIHHLGLQGAFVSRSSTGVPTVRSGGLVGENDGRISASWIDATSFISSQRTTGGLVGRNNINAIVVASYSQATILSGQSIGGLIGGNGGRISTSYSSGRIEQAGASVTIGGISGDGTGSIIASYSNTIIALDMSSYSDLGGLFGSGASSSAIATSYWNIDAQTFEGTSFGGWIFGIGTDDDGTPTGSPGSGMIVAGTRNNNMLDPDETNRLADAGLGLNTSQMRATTGTFPDFSNVSAIVGTTTITGNFSSAWSYQDDCLPRLYTLDRPWNGYRYWQCQRCL